ncbi:hypothetical protein [Rubritalea tangerina]|uniref:hypothetical protein n=1 Tax=Rubritalea tangerina TaxID=430798 RepID=UPI003622C210
MKAPHPSHTFYYTTPLQLTVRILTIIHSQFIVSVDTKNSNPRLQNQHHRPPRTLQMHSHPKTRPNKNHRLRSHLHQRHRGIAIKI